MVHALQEARRVLVPQGILIDLRPVCVDVPIEIVLQEGCESAGLVDMSPEIEHDIAADNAIHVLIGSGVLKELKMEYFDFAYYWNTVKDMKADIDERWKNDVILLDEVVQQAQILFRKHNADGRVRIRVRMKLAKFEKQS